jgi:hypothetical protein
MPLPIPRYLPGQKMAPIPVSVTLLSMILVVSVGEVGTANTTFNLAPH